MSCNSQQYGGAWDILCSSCQCHRPNMIPSVVTGSEVCSRGKPLSAGTEAKLPYGRESSQLFTNVICPSQGRYHGRRYPLWQASCFVELHTSQDKQSHKPPRQAQGIGRHRPPRCRHTSRAVPLPPKGSTIRSSGSVK